MARKQLRFVMTARMKSARRRETQGKSRKMPIPRYPGFQEKTRTSRWCATEDHNNAGWSTNYMYYRTTNQAPEVTAEPDQQLRVSDWCEDEDPAWSPDCSTPAICHSTSPHIPSGRKPSKCSVQATRNWNGDQNPPYFAEPRLKMPFSL